MTGGISVVGTADPELVVIGTHKGVRVFCLGLKADADVDQVWGAAKGIVDVLGHGEVEALVIDPVSARVAHAIVKEVPDADATEGG